MLICFSYIVAIFWWPSQFWLTNCGIWKSLQHDNVFRQVWASGHPWLNSTFTLSLLNSFFSCRSLLCSFILFQVAIHAIGDKANDMILDMYESVASKNGKRDRRFRVMVEIPRIVLLMWSSFMYWKFNFSFNVTWLSPLNYGLL